MTDTETSRLPQTRWGAFAAHLLISLGIFIALSALIYFFLFPHGLFSVAGGIDGIKIVAGVDLVLGPLLTLVIYNISKPRKELYRDLTVIALIQFAALFAGMYLVYQNRPAAVVYSLGTFHTVKKKEFAENDQPIPAGLNLLTPAYYEIQLPKTTSEAAEAIVRAEISSSTSIRLHTNKYLPLDRRIDTARQQLRFNRNTDSAESCLIREVSTHYDTVMLCFDPESQRFSRVSQQAPTSNSQP